MKRMISFLLALAMLMSMSVFVSAEENAALTSLDELVTGEYVMVAGNGFAMTRLDGDWILSEAGDVAFSPAWTITRTENGVKIADSNGNFIAPKGGDKNGIRNGEYEWAVSCENGMFVFAGQGEDTVKLACNVASECRFRAYRNSTIEGNAGGYPCAFALYPVGDRSDAPQMDAPGVVVAADRTKAAPGDTVTYSVILTNAAAVDGGIWNYEYHLNIPQGLTFVKGTVVDTREFLGGIFNEEAKMGTSMSRMGSGYVGRDLILARFTCTVDEGAAGELTVSTYNVVISAQDGISLAGTTGSATVYSTGVVRDVTDAGVTVTADKTDVVPGDKITYTVMLTNAAAVDGGVWNYEYYLDLPQGLTIVEGDLVDTAEFVGGIFDKDTRMGTSMGRSGSGYVGDDLILATFTCSVDPGAEGELTVSTGNVIISAQDGISLTGTTGSTTVTCTAVSTDDANAGVIVTADKTHATTGEIITYTVILTNAAAVEGGVWNYEYHLDIPQGLTILDGAVVDTREFLGGIFNKEAKMGTSMSRLGSGYVGGDLILAEFTCSVDEGAEGELTVSTYDIVITTNEGTSLAGTSGSATVTATIHVCAPEAVAQVPATCVSDGLRAHSKCACGKLYIDGVEVTEAELIIPAKGHTEEIIPGKEATCTEGGLTEGKKCSVCGVTTVEQEIIEAKGHTEEIIPGKEATCTEPGLTEGKKCTVCGEILVAREEIPAKGHHYENGSCIDCGAEDPDYKVVIGLLGDVNRDGAVNSSDVTILFRYATKDATLGALTAEQLLLADVNQDGAVNSSDVTVLFRYVSRDASLAWKPEEITK